jgi:hypothetical protein
VQSRLKGQNLASCQRDGLLFRDYLYIPTIAAGDSRSMAVRKSETFPPVTLGHIRPHGCRDLLVYCSSINCSHGVTMNADHMPDDTPIRGVSKRFIQSPITPWALSIFSSGGWPSTTARIRSESANPIPPVHH